MPVGDIYKSRFINTLGNQTAYNVSFWRIISIVGVEATAVDYAKDLDVKFNVLFKPIMTGAASWWGTGLQLIRPLPVGVEVFYTANAGAGTAGTKATAKQLCGFFNMKTPLAGRNQIGRKYIPFPDVADESTTGPTPTTGYMTRLGAIAGAYLTGFQTVVGPNTITFEPVVYHRTTGTANSIITATSKQKWATQRRRGDFGRPNPPPF